MASADHADKVSNSSDLSDDSGCVDCTDVKTVKDIEPELVAKTSFDVFFLVGDGKAKIGAHKSILMNSSAVFKNMFKEADETKTDFDISDICLDHFTELLRHVYGDENQLSVSNVVGILFAADRFQLSGIKQTCLSYLHNCLEVNNACNLLAEARICGYPEEEKIILAFIGKHLCDILQTTGAVNLTRGLLNEVLTMPGLDTESVLKIEAANRWGRNYCEQIKQYANEENVMNSLQGCFYVDNTSNHRYVMDSVTSRNIFEDNQQPQVLPIQHSEVSGSTVTISSTSSAKLSSDRVLKRLSSANIWPDLSKVTRLQAALSSDINDGIHADAISFTVNHNLYLYGFSIYGPKNQEEGKYQVDTVLYRNKKEVVMETAHIKGAGVILPVLFARPVKIDKNKLYTLELYINGPLSYIGGSGQAQLQSGPALFTFSKTPKIKKNRTDTNKGQIPRLYYLLRQT